MRRFASIALAGLAAAFSLAGLSAAPQAAALVEQEAQLPVEIDGEKLTLETMSVREAGAGRLPIALITHGDPGSSVERKNSSPEAMLGQARDFAHRGYHALIVMRRGYGKSDGATPDGGVCRFVDWRDYLNESADDLEAALRAVETRPDVDASRVVGIGGSAGGAAMIALAARETHPLSAVINISGGIGGFADSPGDNCADSELVWNFARLGRDSRVPTLWLYAENDFFFRPSLVNRMLAGYRGAGGRAKLVMMGPVGADGHTLFDAFEGRRRWLPELDRFLRRHALPTWDETAFENAARTLPPRAASALRAVYAALPTEKAFVLSASGGFYWAAGYESPEAARVRALADCKEEGGEGCTVAAENFDVTPLGLASAAPGPEPAPVAPVAAVQ